MKKADFLLLVITVILLGSGCSGGPKSGSYNEKDQATTDTSSSVDDEALKFLVTAASGGLMEVQLGEMADKNSKSQGVRNFGIMMIKDHGKANEELKAIASAKEVNLPSTVNETHEKHINEMTTLRGAEFDEKYMDMMVEDHQKDIELFEGAAKLNDPEISDFANRTLPVLAKHLNAAQKIRDGLKK